MLWIAALTGSPAAGAIAGTELAVVVEGDRGDVCVVVAEPAVRDGVIGVSSAGPGLPAGTVEQPATSTDAANNTAIRIRPG